MEPQFYKPHLFTVKIPESCILSIQFMLGQSFVSSVL